MGLGVLGMLGSLALAVVAFSAARQSALPSDPGLATDKSGQGFIPIIVPRVVESAAAPTLPHFTPPAGSDLSSPPASDQAPAAVDTSVLAAAPPLWIPDRLVIPAISLDAPVALATLKRVDIEGTLYRQWVAPSREAAGWHGTSAPLGVPGNTVLNGHHNVYGEVFRHLVDLQVGDLILVYSGDRQFAYRVILIKILPEKYESLAVRLQNARWIETSQDERLTLITCWPYINNTHRLIVVATPLRASDVANYPVTPRRTPPTS